MANTVIQLKWSNVTTTPPSLNVAEPAYSNTSHKLFIGDSSGNVIAIGGKFYVDQQALIFTHANAAYTAANTALSQTGAFDHANAAYNQANTAQATGTAAGSYANSAYGQANTATTNAATADSKAVSAGSYANSAFSHANASFTSANTKLSSSGGTISGSLSITGNLTVSGNTTYVDTEILTVEDSLIKLANNNTSGDVVDIGFYGTYNSSGQKYTGLARTAGTNNFFLFKGLTSDPSSNTLASGSVTAANAATLIANVQAYSVTINGVDTETYIGNAYSQANTGVTNAAAASSYANSAFVHANSGFTQANTAQATATAAGSYANSAFAVANTDVTNVSITAGNFGSASIVPTFHVTANGRVDSISNVTIALAASQITSGELSVPRGGTGAGTFTTNGVLLGQGTSALTTASSSTEGHVLTINASGVPTFAHLQGGTF